MEEVLAYADDGAFGILTRARSPARGVAVVLFNAGLIHRPGPLRFHVELARRLAAAGFDAFRLDLPGIGDAPSGADTLAAASRSLDAVARRTGARTFLVGGICSAADLAWRMSASDARIEGLILIDPMAVRGGWYRLGRLQLLLRTPWAELGGKLLRRMRRGRLRTPIGSMAEDYREWPSADAFRARIGDALARGVRVLAFYTGGVADYLLHPRQIDATFAGLAANPGLQLQFHPGLDHILFAARDRRLVVDAVAEWAEGTRPVAAH